MVSLPTDVSTGPVSVSVPVAVPLDGDGVVTVIALVVTTTEVTTVTSVLEPSEVTDGTGVAELPNVVLLLLPVEAKVGTEDTDAVPELRTDEEAEPELLAKGAEVSTGGPTDV